MGPQCVKCHVNSNCRLFLNKDGRKLRVEENYLTCTDGERKRLNALSAVLNTAFS